MYLRIAAADQIVRIEDPDDCSRLHVSVVSGDEKAVDAALRASRHGLLLNADQAWLSVQALRTGAGADVDSSEWPARFEAMIAYARDHGWLSDDGQRVVAHVVREDG